MKPQASRLADVITRATDCIASAVDGMKQPKVVSQRAREIKQLEEEGDAIYQEAIGALFAGAHGVPPDPLDVMKWKELFDSLEDALDECEDVANVLESISIKNS
jgi:uncharacterized protein Yka (UPF0111/DUF47 family)